MARARDGREEWKGGRVHRFSAQNVAREPLIFGTILRNPPKEGWFPSEAGLRMAFRHSRIEVDCGMERE